MTPSEQRSISVIALKNLLIEAIEEPALWIENQDFVSAIKSQGKLAKWQDVERRIIPCALNTLKSAAEDLLEGGYASLDQLRLSALSVIERHRVLVAGSNKTTKSGLRKSVDELERRCSLLEQQNMLMVFLIGELRNKAFRYAQDGKASTLALCEKEMAEISAKIAFTGNEQLIKKAVNRER